MSDVLGDGRVPGGEAIKLTTYFGERARCGGRLLADELLDVCARSAIRQSVLLRGAQGFGAKHRLRTDRLLTLSEDLPLVSVAIDSRERIEALRAQIASLGAPGLVTVERCRLLDAGSFDARASDSGARTSAYEQGHAELKLTVYFGRHQRVGDEAAFVAVCRALREEGVAGATVLVGVDGTVDGVRRRARFFARNADVPSMAISVGEGKQILRAARRLREALGSATMTVERVRVCKRDGLLLEAPHAQPPQSEPLSREASEPSSREASEMASREAAQERWLTKLTVIVSEATQHDKRPVYAEIVRRLRAADAAGATALRGIWGFHGEHSPHGDRLLSLRRHVPVVLIAIDTPERIAALFPIVDELTAERGLVTSERVPASCVAQPAL